MRTRIALVARVPCEVEGCQRVPGEAFDADPAHAAAAVYQHKAEFAEKVDRPARSRRYRRRDMVAER